MSAKEDIKALFKNKQTKVTVIPDSIDGVRFRALSKIRALSKNKKVKFALNLVFIVALSTLIFIFSYAVAVCLKTAEN